MKKKSSSAKKNRKGRTRKEGKGAVNIDDILTEADGAMEAMDMERAISLYATASTLLREKIQLNTDCVQENVFRLAKVLGKLGEAKVSMGDQEGARDDFSSAVSLIAENQDGDDLNKNAELYETRASLSLYLGQLSSDTEALAVYKKGVEELLACIQLREKICQLTPRDSTAMMEDRNDDEDALQEARRQLCGAYCSIADLYLTDLCYEENAEQECENSIQAALAMIDPVDGQPMVDALQAMANLRLSQNRGQEAAENILNAYEKIKKGCEALAALVGLSFGEDPNVEDKAVEFLEVEAASSLPGYEFRCQTAKILLECAATLKKSRDQEIGVANETLREQQCVNAAIQVLGSLLSENDEVIEIWFLAGCAFTASEPQKLDLAEEYWERALEMLLKVKESLEIDIADGEDDAEEQLAAVVTQITEVTAKLKEIGYEVGELDTDDIDMKD